MKGPGDNDLPGGEIKDTLLREPKTIKSSVSLNVGAGWGGGWKDGIKLMLRLLQGNFPL